MTVVEHTAGTWPCLPSAHHFLPEPAESVVFSQAITQERREPDHSVDLFLVWRIFCKNQNFQRFINFKKVKEFDKKCSLSVMYDNMLFVYLI